MARRGSRRRNAETNDFANSPSFETFERELLRSPLQPEVFSDVALADTFSEALPFDRRAFSFDTVESPVMVPASSPASLPEVARAVPRRVVVREPNVAALCVRRERRREVLFAKGKGGGRHRKPRRNENSDIQCK